MSSKGVICSVTPAQLYSRLLRDSAPPPEITAALGRYRYGKGNMQIHYALDAPPRWNGGEELGKVALLHVTPGLDGVSRAANECERGLLPAEPTICVGQPTALDPSRASGRQGDPLAAIARGAALPERRRVRTKSPRRADGRWTTGVREAYADRVEALFSRHIEDFDSLVIARKAYSPADLEAMNVNLVGGDPYGGYCGLDQFFLWRPVRRLDQPQARRCPGLYHIGASTHPGPGLGGGSGFLLANALK